MQVLGVLAALITQPGPKLKGKGSVLPGNQLPLELATPKTGIVELNSNNQSFELLLWVVVKEKTRGRNWPFSLVSIPFRVSHFQSSFFTHGVILGQSLPVFAVLSLSPCSGTRVVRAPESWELFFQVMRLDVTNFSPS